MKTLERRNIAYGRLYHGHFEDFREFVTGDLFTSVLTDSGAIVKNDEAGGSITLEPSDGTVADNDEAYIKTTTECLLIADDKPIYIEAKIKPTEANTNAANHFFGCSNAIAANHLVDNGAGMLTNFSGAAFYKVDGGTLFNVIYSDGTTQSTALLNAANSLDGIAHTATTATYFVLGIEIYPVTSTKVDVNYFIDGIHVYKFKDLTIANATEMQVGAGVKNGSGNHDKLTVEYLAWEQRR